MRQQHHHTKNHENQRALKPAPSKAPVDDLEERIPKWFAVNTRSRCEKTVRKMLEKKGITAYVPIQRLMRRYSRSVRLYERPLITCYVFVKIVKSQYVPVLETEHVTHFVRMGKQLRAIPESEIEILQRITMEKTFDAEAVQGKIETGDTVEIAVGNLAGLRGRVVERAGKHRLAVELEHVGYTILVSVEASILMKI